MFGNLSDLYIYSNFIKEKITKLNIDIELSEYQLISITYFYTKYINIYKQLNLIELVNYNIDSLFDEDGYFLTKLNQLILIGLLYNTNSDSNTVPLDKFNINTKSLEKIKSKHDDSLIYNEILSLQKINVDLEYDIYYFMSNIDIDKEFKIIEMYLLPKMNTIKENLNKMKDILNYQSIQNIDVNLYKIVKNSIEFNEYLFSQITNYISVITSYSLHTNYLTELINIKKNTEFADYNYKEELEKNLENNTQDNEELEKNIKNVEFKKNEDFEENIDIGESINFKKYQENIHNINSDDDNIKNTCVSHKTNSPTPRNGFRNLVEKMKKQVKFLFGYTQNEIDYYHSLDETKKTNIKKIEEELAILNNIDIPIRFQVLSKNIPMTNKSQIIQKIDSEKKSFFKNESKYNEWLNGILKIPFNRYIELPITKKSSKNDISIFLKNSYKYLDEAVYGHIDTKRQIIQLIAEWLSNPSAKGKIFGIQGPMGNGKTTLIKKGISKAIDRPFHIISLGGVYDSSYLCGHSYTYEGAIWGKIVDILIQSKCLNPIIYFDELDKVSKTNKGDEILNTLIHLTDHSQNDKFQDKYFSGIDIDLSRAVFIFSYNDEENISKILLDRFHIIKTSGYNIDDKLQIANQCLIPEIIQNLNIDNDSITMGDNIIKYIINKYTEEEGVRKLKNILIHIYSTFNIYLLTEDVELLNYKDLNISEIPINITEKIIDIILDSSNKNDDYIMNSLYN